MCSGTEHFRRLRSSGYSCSPRLVRSLTCSLKCEPAAGLQRYLDFDQRYYLPDDILYKVDRISMAHSLEVRPPFLDQRIVDFAASLPERFKLRGSNSKYVLRRLMKDKLPRSVSAAAENWLRCPHS